MTGASTTFGDEPIYPKEEKKLEIKDALMLK